MNEGWIRPTCNGGDCCKFYGRQPKEKVPMIDKKFAVRTILYAIVFLLIGGYFACNTLGHAATTSTQRHPNSLGVVPYDSNPLVYLAGNVKSTDWIDGNLNLRFLPLGTYALYDQNILLCGNPLEKFQGVIEPFMLVYERQSHRAVQGVGCHELRGAYSLVVKKGLN